MNATDPLSPHFKTADGSGWLHAAASKDSATLASYHARDGSPLEEPDAQGRTPLALACELAHWNAAQALLDAGADPMVALPNGRLCGQALAEAIPEIFAPRFARILVDKILDGSSDSLPEWTVPSSVSSAARIIFDSHPGAVEGLWRRCPERVRAHAALLDLSDKAPPAYQIFLEQGAQDALAGHCLRFLGWRGLRSREGLDLACVLSKRGMAETLGQAIASGYPPNGQPAGGSPLIAAIGARQADCATLLVEAGADPSRVQGSAYGTQNAFDAARAAGGDMIEILRNALAAPEAKELRAALRAVTGGPENPQENRARRL